ncbi:hypothetical protein SUGI_0179660 [Cryptomeria japonica]|nr:hypothetical protein SUGI_0179660 [Cryptomeria japonica]
MERSRMSLFSLVLDCFAPAQPYEQDNNDNIQLPQRIEEEENTEDFEQGVRITVQRLAGGSRQVKRVQFSRQVFSERQARLWWEENGVRVRQHYASAPSPSTSGI